MQRVAVIDYGMGNLRSVEKALDHVADRTRHEIVITDDPSVVEEADRVVFPGQGAIRDCMHHLRQCGLEGSVRRAAREKPFLGICIGLQALMDSSAEDPATPGLGIFAGNCERFAARSRDPASGARLKVPHMGWNQVHQRQPHPLWHRIADGERFYFVHSYYVVPRSETIIAGTSAYPEPFCCAVADGWIFGVQFHPEKSQDAGLLLLENFLSWSAAI